MKPDEIYFLFFVENRHGRNKETQEFNLGDFKYGKLSNCRRVLGDQKRQGREKAAVLSFLQLQQENLDF